MSKLLLASVNIGNKLPLGTGQSVGQTYKSVSPLLSSILKNSLTLISIIFLFLLIAGGILFIISAGSGDEKKAGQAKSALTSALIGFAVVFCSYFIIQIVEVITGVQILIPNL